MPELNSEQLLLLPCGVRDIHKFELRLQIHPFSVRKLFLGKIFILQIHQKKQLTFELQETEYEQKQKLFRFFHYGNRDADVLYPDVLLKR